MARIKIDLPESFSFVVSIPVRITDLNYGGHVGNDSILSIAHEARMKFLGQHGFSEMDLGGVGLIMSEAALEFKKELFYGETAIVSIACSGFNRVGFEIYYRMEKEINGRRQLVAVIKTAMVGFDYKKGKIAAIPETAQSQLQSK
jgi:acyl-CoA thioesterase FadM